MTPNKIAMLQNRDPKTVRKVLNTKVAKKTLRPKGRPPMSAADFAKCDKALIKMQKQVKANKEITAIMVAKKAGVSYGEKCVRKHLALHGKPFRKLREKPLLTPADVEKRFLFARRNYQKTKAWSMEAFFHLVPQQGFIPSTNPLNLNCPPEPSATRGASKSPATP